MIYIDENKNIEVSWHDTFSIRFKFKDYLLTESDRVIFSIKKTTTSTDLEYEDSFYNAGKDYVDIVVPKGALDDLAPGSYVYDAVVINDKTGQIVTFFFAKNFRLMGVVHNV